MPRPRSDSAPTSDRGAYAVMYAVLSVALVGVASIVIDLATLRLDRRVDRAAADAAAIAGAGQLGEDGGNPVGACKRAIDYIASNLNADRPGDDCARLLAGLACDANTPAQSVSVDIDERTVTLTWPVPDGNELLTRPDVEAAEEIGITLDETPSDGSRCQRLGIEIFHDRTFLFGGIFGGVGATTRSKSVGLARLHSTGDLPVPIVTLHQTACNAIVVPEGQVSVGEGETHPGEVAVDSDARACGTDPVIDVAAAGRLTADRTGIFRLGGAPTYPRVSTSFYSRGWRVTAQPWTDRYNCPDEPASCGLSSAPLGSPVAYDYLNQWIAFGKQPPSAPPALPSHVLTPSPPWDMRTGPNCVITTGAAVETPVHFEACDGDLVEIASGVAVTFNQGFVSHHDVIIHSGAEVTFNGPVHIGGQDANPEDMDIRGATVTVAGGFAVTGRLTLAETARVTFNAASPDVRLRELLVESSTLTAYDPINVSQDLTIGAGATATFSDSARVGDDLFVSGAVETAGSLDVRDTISVGAGGRLAADGAVRSGGATSIGASGFARFTGHVAVQGTLQVGGCVLIADADETHCTNRPAAVSTGTGSDGSNVYIGGDLRTTESSALVANRSFVYVAGYLTTTAPNSLVSLVAPYGANPCSVGTAPSPECFDDLAVWAAGTTPNTSSPRHQLGIGSGPCDQPGGGIGGACVNGTVITPNGDLDVRWSGAVELNHAQFVARRLIFDGDVTAPGALTIRPDPERTTLIPQSAGFLIR